nr:hypothetical protein CFP56_38998 [Quercus suber]
MCVCLSRCSGVCAVGPCGFQGGFVGRLACRGRGFVGFTCVVVLLVLFIPRAVSPDGFQYGRLLVYRGSPRSLPVIASHDVYTDMYQDG